MPSARELLEQADALMRRNRSPLMDDIPVLTDAVPEVRPVGPARLRPSLPESREPDALSADSIPMLTERGPDAPASATPQVAPPAAVVEEGEPSDWLQLDGGEPSVIGDAPDSIAMVPPFEQEVSEEIEVEALPEVEASFDAELAERGGDVASSLPPPPEPVPVEPASLETAPLETAPLETAPLETAPLETAPFETASPEPAPFEPASPEPLPPEPAPFEPPPEVRIAEVELLSEPPTGSAWEGDTIIDESDEALLAAAEIERSAELTGALADEGAPIEDSAEAGPSPAERQAAEDARWASMAEEIRMQVLQRIDLFTDTGLRDQLGSRLQPIVDRASADLVATINQHVGELLRSYVAEAIEREIENWRRGI